MHLICSVFIPQHLKDKFWNFIFYKFIFIFGVLNVQTVEEVVMWCLWFSALVFLHLMVQLCKDRFEYVSIIKYNCFFLLLFLVPERMTTLYGNPGQESKPKCIELLTL